LQVTFDVEFQVDADGRLHVSARGTGTHARLGGTISIADDGSRLSKEDVVRMAATAEVHAAADAVLRSWHSAKRELVAHLVSVRAQLEGGGSEPATLERVKEALAWCDAQTQSTRAPAFAAQRVALDNEVRPALDRLALARERGPELAPRKRKFVAE
jgi:molecular chaperone DnaK (HSP70)